RVLDLRDRLDAVFLEVAEDADEPRAELRPALLEISPVHDVPSLVGHTKLLKGRLPPAVVPPLGSSARRVNFSLAATFVERIRSGAEVEAERHRVEVEVAPHRVQQVAP